MRLRFARRDGLNVHPPGVYLLAMAVLGSLGLGACAGNAAAVRSGESCREQIILSLAPGYTRTEDLMEELSREADVRLEYLRSASPTLFVYRLTAGGDDPECVGALGRLRQDPRVRFAELDAPRRHHDPNWHRGSL